MKPTGITNPVDYIKRFSARHYPHLHPCGNDVGLHKGGYVDFSFRSDANVANTKLVRVVRLMLPHAAPADSRPLLERFCIGERIRWDFTHDHAPYISLGDVHRVHLWEFQGSFLRVTVRADVNSDTVIGIGRLDGSDLQHALRALALTHVAKLWGMKPRKLTREEIVALRALTPKAP